MSSDRFRIPKSFFSRFDTRRGFLRDMGLASTAAFIGVIGSNGCAKRQSLHETILTSGQELSNRSSVSFVAGNDRREMIFEAMRPFRDEIRDSIAGKEVMIKLNCVGQSGHPLMVTHPDAVRGILDFLKPIHDRAVIIAESTVQNKNPERTFDIFGYRPLEREYNARIVELNHEPTSWCWILDGNLYPQRIRVIKPLLDRSNYIISVTRLKTHNAVVATLSLKNVVMGSPLKIPSRKINEKSKMHGGFGKNSSPKMINLNIFLMAHRVRPDFAVLDGLEGVEGNGPAHGDPVDHGVAAAGPDYLAVDRIGAELMAVPWENIGYLNYCATAGLGQADLSRINVIGADWREYVRTYRLHDNIDYQLGWKDDILIQHGDKE